MGAVLTEPNLAVHARLTSPGETYIRGFNPHAASAVYPCRSIGIRVHIGYWKGNQFLHLSTAFDNELERGHGCACLWSCLAAGEAALLAEGALVMTSSFASHELHDTGPMRLGRLETGY